MRFEILGFPTLEEHGRNIVRILPFAHSGYLGRSAAVLGVVDLYVLVVDFPQQTVQLLFVLPVPVKHQRDDGQHQQQRASDNRQYFRGVR